MQPGSIRSLLSIGACLGMCAACGTSPVTYSAPVGLTLKAKSKRLELGRIIAEQAIGMEAGNPYGAFIADATARFGHDPSVIRVEHAELVLGATSKGVSRLDEVLSGDLAVSFSMSEPTGSYPVATGAIAAGGDGALPFGISFLSDDVPDADYVKLLAGNFKVVAEGSVAPAFDPGQLEDDQGSGNNGNIKVDLQLTLMFSATE